MWVGTLCVQRSKFHTWGFDSKRSQLKVSIHLFHGSWLQSRSNLFPPVLWNQESEQVRKTMNYVQRDSRHVCVWKEKVLKCRFSGCERADILHTFQADTAWVATIKERHLERDTNTLGRSMSPEPVKIYFGPLNASFSALCEFDPPFSCSWKDLVISQTGLR